MSLIIKGMEMPQAGDVIICGQIEGKLQCTIVTRGKPIKWCEISEVSTPHGRLIDATALKNKIESDYCNKCADVDECGVCVCQNCGIDTLFEDIDDTPATIEAEVN